MKNEEWEKFKEFILNKTQHLENNIIKINPGAMDTKLNDVICKLERYSERLNQIEIIANKDKVITDGVHDLQTWKNEARQQISYHDVYENIYNFNRDLSFFSRIDNENSEIEMIKLKPEIRKKSSIKS